MTKKYKENYLEPRSTHTYAKERETLNPIVVTTNPTTGEKLCKKKKVRQEVGN